ncbi:MAG: hypothetical protein HYZ54_13645 [Ignavibacteriae bacterium]|nr:hypothetical protein [Ignavibacteriota bacterium]
MTQVRHEGDKAFPVPEEKGTPTESSSENKPADIEPSSGGENTPSGKEKDLHLDERFKEVISQKNALKEEAKELRRQVAELAEFRTKAEPLIEKFQPKEEVQIPEWFGGNQDQWKAFKANQESIINDAKERAIKEIDERTSQEQRRIQEANTHFESSVRSLEEEGNEVDRNKLLKFVMDNEMVDGKGRWNYKAGYKFMAAMEKASEQPSTLPARKKLAASTTSEAKAEQAPREYKTSADFKGGNAPW